MIAVYICYTLSIRHVVVSAIIVIDYLLPYVGLDVIFLMIGQQLEDVVIEYYFTMVDGLSAKGTFLVG